MVAAPLDHLGDLLGVNIIHQVAGTEKRMEGVHFTKNPSVDWVETPTKFLVRVNMALATSIVGSSSF